MFKTWKNIRKSLWNFKKNISNQILSKIQNSIESIRPGQWNCTKIL